MKRLTFPKNKRLITNRQFRAVLARRLRVSDKLLTIYVAENDCGYPRLGVSIGKSVGNAVVRNRLKRLLREVFRQNQMEIAKNFDYLVMVSTGSAGSDKSKKSEKPLKSPTFEQIKTSFLTLAAKAANIA